MDDDRILITGGSGFIGTNLVQHLIDGKRSFLNVDIQEPLNQAHRPFWVKGDILDESALKRIFSNYQPSHVVHLAARTDLDEKKSLDGYRVNIQGTENVLRCISRTSSVRRVMITSSMLVCRLGYVPASDGDYAPPNLYGESKVLSEKITRKFEMACTWLITRPTTIWGPWSFRYRDELFAVLEKGYYFHPGSKPVIKTYGYVGNVSHQICQLLELPDEVVQGKTFYLGDPPMDLRVWTDKFSKGLRGKKAKAVPFWLLRGVGYWGDLFLKLGIPFPLTSFRLMNMTVPQILDVEKTIRVTGDAPYTLDDGVCLTIEWLRKCPKT